MKKHLPLFFACILSAGLSAQSLEPSVNASAGTSFSNSSGQLDWTLGEPVISTLEPSGTIVSQGFHQPEITVSTDIAAEEQEGIKVYPNPAITSVQMEFGSASSSRSIELRAADGKLVWSQKAADAAISLQMQQYPAGSYILYIRENNTTTRSYKIIKSN